MQISIKSIFQGKEKEYKRKKSSFLSAYKKDELKEKVFVNTLGLELDSQGDKKSHGGEDRAVCVYTQKAYYFFKNEYDIDLEIGSFGENITLEDLGDEDICLGDIFTCGDALFEVCQPRLPCWKISFLTGIKNLTSLVVKEGKTGFQLRVLKEGFISKDDEFILIERKHKNISIAFINKCYFDAKNYQEEIKSILQIPQLAKAYKKALEKRYVNKSFGIAKFQEDKV